MTEIRHVRSCNKPARNGFATVVNWTYAGNGLSIGQLNGVGQLNDVGQLNGSVKSNCRSRGL
jgi:hypothetical protein